MYLCALLQSEVQTYPEVNGHFNVTQVCAAVKSRNLVVFSSVAFCAKAVAETLGILQLQDRSDLGKN